MLGDAAPLRALADACGRTAPCWSSTRRTGSACRAGRPRAGRAGRARGRPHVLVTATLSKSLGSQGGAVLGPARLRRAPRQHGADRSSSTPASRPRPRVGARGARRLRARARSCPARCAATERGRWPRLRGRAGRPAAVLSVPMPSPQVGGRGPAAAASAGVRVGCFRPPSVPDGLARLRITARADLTDADLAARRGRAGRGRRARHGQGDRGRARAGRHRNGHRRGQDRRHRRARGAAPRPGRGRQAGCRPASAPARPGRPRRRRTAHRAAPSHEFARYADPLAPDTAARLAPGARLGRRRRGPAVRSPQPTHDLVLVEGAGGLLVRLDTDRAHAADLAALLAAPVVVVAARRARHPQPHRAHRRRARAPRARRRGRRDRRLARRPRAGRALQTCATCRPSPASRCSAPCPTAPGRWAGPTSHASRVTDWGPHWAGRWQTPGP